MLPLSFFLSLRFQVAEARGVDESGALISLAARDLLSLGGSLKLSRALGFFETLLLVPNSLVGLYFLSHVLN